MNELLKAIYDDFYNKPPAVQLKEEIERSHQELIGRLDKLDRKLLLNIIDCKDQTSEELSIDSFIAGFHLGWKLSHELNMYDREHPVSTSDFVQ